jgi:flagellar M-ring protein FliF
MNRILAAITAFFRPLSPAQRLLFAVMAGGILVATVSLFVWASRPDYTLLFGNLSAKSASSIVEQLQNNTVPYELRDGGAAIYVPRDRVYELRLQFAGEGVSAQGGDYKGYELFDATTLGMTDFMQRVNLKRALEGELARTISSLNQVEFARVHLVMPERSPFIETTVQPSASVILNVKAGRRLTQQQIDGISSLISGSVEGLPQNNVVILDQHGNKISENNAAGSDIGLSNTQLKVRQTAENYLTEKGQSMLDRVVGPGNAILKVSTEHDFQRLSRESNLIDPESRIVISEEVRSESMADQKNEGFPQDQELPLAIRTQIQGQPKSTNSQNSQVRVRNYEVNQTHEKFEKPVGEISRIYASVTLNQKKQMLKDVSGKDSVVMIPYTAAELNNLSSLVRTAIGMNPVRGDQLTISQFAFEDTFTNQILDEQRRLEEQLQMNDLIRWGVIVAALTLAFYVLYRILRQNYPNAVPPLFFDTKPEVGSGAKGDQKALPREGGYGEGPETQMLRDQYGEPSPGLTDIEKATDVYRRKLSPEAQRRLEMKSKMFDEIKGFAETKPDEAANMIRSLMMQKPER